MFAGPNLYDYVICPNAGSHLVMLSNMPFHLPGCAKKFPSANLARCPYNSTHMYTIDDIFEHVIQCPSFIRGSEEKKELKETVEDWDAEPPVPTYNPNIHCEANPIIRSLHGATRSARKAFRERERKRIMDLNNFH
ncbi:gametocyte-specific factor 1 homolog [Drosophila mauritiana]|uniref:Gametocyte-specific factor 1 homolog n=1 Tax=Drosophila mauritiana TaxID=7226 RepID=A0A6P8KIA3_DROMA|nr:gametocyte-specific factor 1 homolog [Drosophila mauritiana]